MGMVPTCAMSGLWLCLKKNLNASRPFEHPPVRKKMSKRLGGIIGGVIVPFFLTFLFCFLFCFFNSRGSFVDVPRIFSCPADHVPDWQPRSILLGMFEAGSVNVKNTATTTTSSLLFTPPLRVTEAGIVWHPSHNFSAASSPTVLVLFPHAVSIALHLFSA